MYISITEFIKAPSAGLKRGGIVPYVERFLPGKRLVRFYCLGIDYYFDQITEFSGKIDNDKDRDIIDTALREFQEETGSVFPPITRRDLIAQNADVLYDDLTLLIFVRVNVDMLNIVDRYDIYIQPKIAIFEEWKQKHPVNPWMTEKTSVIPQRRQLSAEESALNPEIATLIWLTESQLRAALEENNVPPVFFYYPSGRLLLQGFSNRSTDQCLSPRVTERR